MDDMNSFERLALQARAELPPDIDVTAAVVRQIRRPPVTISTPPLWAFARFAAVAAAAMAALAIYMPRPTADDMPRELFPDFSPPFSVSEL